MSNYTVATDFAAKDALATGDTNKLVKGTEISAEFDAIAVATNSKADAADAALSGTLTGDYTINCGTY